MEKRWFGFIRKEFTPPPEHTVWFPALTPLLVECSYTKPGLEELTRMIPQKDRITVMLEQMHASTDASLIVANLIGVDHDPQQVTRTMEALGKKVLTYTDELSAQTRGEFFEALEHVSFTPNAIIAGDRIMFEISRLLTAGRSDLGQWYRSQNEKALKHLATALVPKAQRKQLSEAGVSLPFKFLYKPNVGYVHQIGASMTIPEEAPHIKLLKDIVPEILQPSSTDPRLKDPQDPLTIMRKLAETYGCPITKELARLIRINTLATSGSSCLMVTDSQLTARILAEHRAASHITHHLSSPNPNDDDINPFDKLPDEA
jgi:hypothetical protein